MYNLKKMSSGSFNVESLIEMIRGLDDHTLSALTRTVLKSARQQIPLLDDPEGRRAVVTVCRTVASEVSAMGRDADEAEVVVPEASAAG